MQDQNPREKVLEKVIAEIVDDLSLHSREHHALAALAVARSLVAMFEAANDEMEEVVGDPNRHKTLFETWRALNATWNRSAWGVLLAIGMDYLVSGEPIDDFYRDLSSMFIECDAGTIAAILSIADHVDDYEQVHPGEGIHLSYADRDSGTTSHAELSMLPQTERAIRLLQSHGFCATYHRGLTVPGVPGAASDRWKRLVGFARSPPIHAEPEVEVSS